MKSKELLSLLSKRFSLPKATSVRKVILSFTMAEKAVFLSLISIFILSSLTMVWRVSEAFLVDIPTYGGTLTEGVIGNPRFINPVLAISEADRNLTALVYSGLVRITPEGKIENDLAESVILSPDRLTYTVHIRPSAAFQDGEPVTADDVIFTISKIIDPQIKSPKRGNWDGVTLEKVDELTINFTLKQAYTPFIYNLATGILPKHIWKNVSDDEFSFSQFNTLPVGSGPYRVDKVETNSGGIPNYYMLVPYSDKESQAPYISHLNFRFYPNEEALIAGFNKGEIDSLSGITPDKLLDLNLSGSRVISSPLPRVFAVFFNQSHSKVLANMEVRRALDIISPRERIVENILGGYATAIDTALPAGMYEWAKFDSESLTEEERFAEATEILTKAGWKKNEETGLLEKKTGSGTIPLSFSISTGDAPELQAVAEELKKTWEKLGAEVRLVVYETGDLNQNIIRPRNFDALLFGEVVGRNVDLYPFWHSSQRQDPGLNIALYANSRADTYLDNTRSAEDFEVIEKNYKSFVEELEKDVPAVFLYTPSFLYVVPESLAHVTLGSMTVSQDRFLGVKDWYVETDRVWKIFVKN